MLAAFLESTKFIAHLLPVSFLRIFFGYLYTQEALNHIALGWLDRPLISARLGALLPQVDLNPYARILIETIGIPFWQEVSFLVIAIELAVGISFLLGYLVRPLALLASLLVLGQMSIAGPDELVLLKIILVVQIFLAWIGAGRVLGLDYYFYKKDRGIWW